MASLPDSIVSVFLDKQAHALKNTEVSIALVNQGIPCNPEDVRRHVQLLSPALFQLIPHEDKTITIRVDPKMEICSQFLGKGCQAEAKTCEKLHICRHFQGNCPSQNCRFPHDFSRGINQRIIKKNNCEYIDPKLLVRFLRFSKVSLMNSGSRPPYNRGGNRGNRGGGHRGRGRGRGGPGFANPSNSRPLLKQNDDLNRKMDVSFPSSKLAEQIDIEIIEMLLNTKDIKIENKSSEDENEYFRRATIRLTRTDDMEKLLGSPIIHHHGVDIKFKRANPIIDKTSFQLEISIDGEQDKIDSPRMKLYVDRLVGNQLKSTIWDLSSDSEQIILVTCDGELDFAKVREAHQSKTQLSGKDVKLTQVHEYEAVEIRYNIQNKSITEDHLKIILGSVWRNIFAYNFPPDGCAEVEFISADVCKQWMSTIDRIQNKFDLTIKPITDSVDDDSETRSTTSSRNVMQNHDTHSMTSRKSDDVSRSTKIKLRDDWAMIAAHPRFVLEYKEFIRKDLGGEIDIHEDEAIYNGTFPRHVDGLRTVVVLGNKTKDFMQQFKFERFHKLEANQVDILRASSATVAYSRVNESDYLVATKFKDMSELKQKVFTKKNPRPQPDPSMNRYPSVTSLTTASPKPGTTENSQGISSGASTSMYSISAPEQMSMFSIDTFEDRLRQYLQETFSVRTILERTNNNNNAENAKVAKSRIIVKVIGQINDVQNAIQELDDLFASICTKQFDDKTDGNWTKIAEATQVIQHHFNLVNLMCTCQQISPTIVNVNYFDIKNPQFGVDEQRIEDLIMNKFQTATITYDQQTTPAQLMKDWTGLEEKIRKRNDYKQNICLYKEPNAIYLFGLSDLVKEFRQTFEQLKTKHDPQSCKINLSERQLNYLKYVAKADMNKLEKQYKSDGCDISLARLRQSGEFSAPPDMHSKITASLEAIAHIKDISFVINKPGFEILVSKEPERLMAIVKSKCFLEKNIDIHRIHIPVPKAQIADPEESVKQAPSASATPNVTSVNISHSTVTITIGDLAMQAVDAIVACSSSENLCRSIIKNAGDQVLQEYSQLKSTRGFPGTTSAGNLRCKRILFIPWEPISHNESDVKLSLNSFIQLAFDTAMSIGYKSLAFPAVGCGGFQFDPPMIAKYMLLETQKQLVANKNKMNISFILMPEQRNVYDEFIKYLNEMHTINPMVSAKIPTKKQDDQLTIPYDEKIIKITLISPNDDHLMKCRHEITELANTFSTKLQLTNKQDMLDWSQNTIYKYYDCCLKQRVIPTLDLANVSLELVGAKDAIRDAEKYFYELTNETFKEARIHAVSRGVIWSVELTSSSDTWEQYSFKLNGVIEDAYLKKHAQVDFENDKEEKCRINFSAMEERTETKTRRIRRKLVDSTLPDTWEPSDQNCKRVKLQSTSAEYQNILAQFHVTMLGKYSQIVSIERIQNERWYKQYAAHREDFRRRSTKLDERLLFHGCPYASADQIILGCFNRSFAGINGVAFGCGVYFHAQANYSHSYTLPVGPSGERTMFLVRVLIGKTCKGDKSMKVVPSGYDTTTDGQHIFVVYHDAGAYADHLITYK